MTEVVDLSRSLPATIFLSGVYAATFAGAGLFFFKFWRKTRERFFRYFGLACWMLAAERTCFLRLNPLDEPNSWLYLLRLTAFILIMRTVISANLARKRPD